MQNTLNGLALQFFRGIGPQKQKIGPFKKFNFFIGPNNSGKSTVIDFIYSHIPFPNDQIKERSNHPDKFLGKETGNIHYEIGFPPNDVLENAIFRKSRSIKEEEMRRNLSKIIEASTDGGLLWVTREEGIRSQNLVPVGDLEKFEALQQPRYWSEWALEVGNSAGDFKHNFYRIWLSHTRDILKLPKDKPVLIPAKRIIGPKDQPFQDYSGQGLIDELVRYQNPKHDEEENREVFRKINRFVATVLERENAHIEIPHDREHITVHIDNKVLPLSSLGTGIHEVVLIASACTITSEKIVCLEEPETHLHPLLQRRLIDYLREETDNQYFVATHSATFIDTSDAAMFQVSNDGSQTYIKPALVKSEKRRICHDLGFKASDILQTNAIIWVEGPSDRIYLNHWINAVDPRLLEGLHYTVMFYGGRLLSHLSADDYQVSGFIDLLSINRNAAILIDSDRAKKGDKINETKQRIRKEFENAGGFCWITQGREIENYIDPKTLQDQVRLSHPKIYKEPNATGPYSHALEFVRNAPKKGSSKTIERDIDKVAVASGIAKVEGDQPNLEILDLKKKIYEITKFLATANALPSRI